ncbi:glycosyltransferase family 2 protein [Candidatus Burkholderia verschuerenii]|uniref:glycosyltransferase family 2 protein n=1 Tax=Candidatus Burkholderia verschuerenii TaxID=242163 RepID=UPI001E45E720|nr:glycosyltransferase family 2 protein [Candidatus Burkholderia verschuerenii]
MRRYDSIGDGELQALAERLATLDANPVFSVVVPLYNTPASFLRKMIESVLGQTYPHWELCMVDDASNLAHMSSIVDEYARRDSRIKFERRSSNGHICVASNDAITLARGDFIALLDHDDVLPPHALQMIAQYAAKHPDAKMFFSDEDKLAPDGSRVQPYFKSDWNAVLMLGQNMFSHFGVFDADLVRSVDGFRPGFEGSQDHDLALRCAERLRPEQIVHVPHVLYHWRVSADSTALDVAAKPYAHDASLRAVREHLVRCGADASVEPISPASSMLRVIFGTPQPAPRISITIPTRDRADLLERCIGSLRERTRYANYEIVIVNNGSTERNALELLDHYKQLPDVQVVSIDEPFNYSDLNNRASAVATGEYLCLLNNDTEVHGGDWLSILCGYASQPDVGAVGPALWYPDGRLQHGGVLLGIGDLAGHYHHLVGKGDPGYFGRAVLAQEVSAVSAACLVVRKSLYESVGGLDALNLRVAFNDVDFCLKLRAAGYRNIYVPYASLIHHESASRRSDAEGPNAERFAREVAWMRQRWENVIDNDPCYNPNLALQGAAAFSLAFPPRIGMLD